MSKSIVTKFGDSGKTLLYGGKVVDKDDIRIEICGAIDELNSYLGVAKNIIPQAKIKKNIESLQKDLFVISSEVATEPRAVKKIKKRIDNSSLVKIEDGISSLEKKGIPQKKGFFLPGGSTLSGILDISRTVTRRAERQVVTLIKKKRFKNKHVLIYLNRLSDFLFLLARFYDSK